MKNNQFLLFSTSIAAAGIPNSTFLIQHFSDSPPPPQDWLRAGLPVKLSAVPLFLRLLIGCLGCLGLNAHAANFSVPFPDPLPAHPRLLASTEDFTALREQVKTDPVSARFFAEISQQADAMLAQPPVTYKLEGKRLLSISNEAFKRISTLAMMARLTGDARYSDRAIVEMRAVSAFQDWNPSHFLDTAEMTLGVAIGYDWLYEQLSADDRITIARAILELGLKPSETGPTAKPHWWISGINNWNQVCHAGMVAGAIAIADQQPEVSRRIIERAASNLHFAADSYAPDGAYPEGPSYWGYGTTFHVILVQAIEKFTGKPSGLDAFPGFLASADYMLQMVTPTGAFYNYSDCHWVTGVNLTQYWFARRTGRADLLFGNVALLAAVRDSKAVERAFDRIRALALLWLDPRLNTPAAPPPLSWYGRGLNPVATHRSAWGDPRATFIGLKGGAASVSHGHMDSGSFLLEADGVRWGFDPGLQSYITLESKGVKLWSGGEGGPRWNVFRLGPEAHNILRFDGAPPRVAGRGELVRFSAAPPTAVVNLDAVYEGQVASVSRGVALQSDRSVLIRDEWSTSAKAVEVTWQMLTRADHVQAGEGEVHLAEGNATLTLRVLKPADAKITIEDFSEPRTPTDAPNPKLKRITITTHTAASTTGGFIIHAVPGSSPAAERPTQEALADWGEPLSLR